MECRLQGICKFCQPGEMPGAVIFPLANPDRVARLLTLENATKEEAAAFALGKKRPYTRKTRVGGGSIKEITMKLTKPIPAAAGRIPKRKYVRKEHPGKGNGVRSCKKCEFTCEGQGDMMRHYRVKHPGKSAMGLDSGKENLESTTNLKINKDKDVRHAFDILQTRSNDCTLSREEQKSFDKLEDQTADIASDVSKWPIVIRTLVIKLYNEVVNGVLEEK